jgi:hypothetical protein
MIHEKFPRLPATEVDVIRFGSNVLLNVLGMPRFPVTAA